MHLAVIAADTNITEALKSFDDESIEIVKKGSGYGASFDHEGLSYLVKFTPIPASIFWQKPGLIKRIKSGRETKNLDDYAEWARDNYLDESWMGKYADWLCGRRGDPIVWDISFVSSQGFSRTGRGAAQVLSKTITAVAKFIESIKPDALGFYPFDAKLGQLYDYLIDKVKHGKTRPTASGEPRKHTRQTPASFGAYDVVKTPKSTLLVKRDLAGNQWKQSEHSDGETTTEA